MLWPRKQLEQDPADKHKETHLSGVCMYMKFRAGAAFRIALMMAKFYKKLSY